MIEINIRDEVRAKTKDFKLREGREPTKLALRNADETRIIALGPLELPEFYKFNVKGVRESIEEDGGKFMGLEVTWGANELSVY